MFLLIPYICLHGKQVTILNFVVKCMNYIIKINSVTDVIEMIKYVPLTKQSYPLNAFLISLMTVLIWAVTLDNLLQQLSSYQLERQKLIPSSRRTKITYHVKSRVRDTINLQTS